MSRVNADQSNSDRRDAQAPRMQYEALVEVGAAASGGFEAESVDLSLDGIRLRTAYLPEPGELLLFRFDGFGGEVIAEGEVMWCEDGGRGGDFGVRFTRLDKRGARLLESMCNPTVDEPEAGEAVASGDRVGTKVRLHISGLASPMRARVRDTARGEVLIGSSLDFLRVGRDVELENMEQADRRSALIEHVSVEIDPETQVPQLVVALRYDGGEPQSEDLPTAPIKVEVQGVPAARGVSAAPQPEKETTPEPQVIDNEAADYSPSAPSMSARFSDVASDELESSAPHTLQTPVEADQAHAVDDLEVEMDESEPEPRSVHDKMGALAKKLGPKLACAGAGAKGALGSIVNAVRRKRQERTDAREKSRAPKRTTAPPPTGALRSDGKRLFREQVPTSVQVEEPPPKKRRPKRALFGAVIGIIAVVALYVGATQLNGKGASIEDPPAAAAKPAETVPLKAPALPSPPAAGPIATAKVPLFGATPLSTTEPVPVPPNLDGDLGSADGEDSSDGKDAKAPADLQKEWGIGDVDNPVVLRIKMDGQISGLSGQESATGFTLVIPGRKSVSSAAGLARKDKRIESVNVINYPDRTEVTVSFKGDTPAFLATTNGKKLFIEIDGSKKRKRTKKRSKKSKKSKKKRAASKSKKRKKRKKSKKSSKLSKKPKKRSKKSKKKKRK